jgi:outer membrane protein assembly factor BamD (BamD/ComL family)
METIHRTELPGMLATLCSYENLFGPYHPQTLRLMAEVANAYWRAGELSHARPLLERAVRDLGRHLGPEHDLYLRALTTLRDLFVAQRDYERAGAAQRELLECQIRRLGSDHSETLAARARLAAILFENVNCNLPGNPA